MSVALFVPCYIDQFFPDVGIATLELLERLGVDVAYPPGQTCCGQPMANTGCLDDTAPVARRWVDQFADYETIVCPSGSCTSMIRNHYASFYDDGDPRYSHVQQRTFELCEYLHDELQVDQFDVHFPHRISLHQSCHGLRELRLGGSSESMTPRPDKIRRLLELVADLEICELQRRDECCGFGGTFSVSEAGVSAAMGRDRVADHLQSGSEVIVAADMSCLMHLQGIIRRDKLPLQVMHVAQLLVGRPLSHAAAVSGPTSSNNPSLGAESPTS